MNETPAECLMPGCWYPAAQEGKAPLCFVDVLTTEGATLLNSANIIAANAACEGGEICAKTGLPCSFTPDVVNEANRLGQFTGIDAHGIPPWVADDRDREKWDDEDE